MMTGWLAAADSCLFFCRVPFPCFCPPLLLFRISAALAAAVIVVFCLPNWHWHNSLFLGWHNSPLAGTSGKKMSGKAAARTVRTELAVRTAFAGPHQQPMPLAECRCRLPLGWASCRAIQHPRGLPAAGGQPGMNVNRMAPSTNNGEKGGCGRIGVQVPAVEAVCPFCRRRHRRSMLPNVLQCPPKPCRRHRRSMPSNAVASNAVQCPPMPWRSRFNNRKCVSAHWGWRLAGWLALVGHWPGANMGKAVNGSGTLGEEEEEEEEEREEKAPLAHNWARRNWRRNWRRTIGR
jgi:hypothetical protein